MTATLHDDRLTLETSRIARVYDWNGGRLRTLRIVDKRSGRSWECPLSAPDLDLPGLPAPTAPATFTRRLVPASAALEAHQIGRAHV